MRFLEKARLLILTSVIPTLLPAQVAPEFTHGPHIVSLGGTADGACLKTLQALQREMVLLRFPDEWTVAVTCNSVTWGQAKRRAGNPSTSTAFTGLTSKWTVINSDVVRGLTPIFQHTLAHELGHIRCNCVDESRAEAEARALIYGARDSKLNSETANILANW
jgi:hypothetical protein